MSLLEELESRGVTAEDLEKAASVRLFEKAAAAEGVDLDSLDVDQVEDLYAAFVANQSYDDTTKEASAMNDEIVDLFEKTAAAEGIDLDDMDDVELAELYNHYVENVLPEQLEDFGKEAAAYEEEEAYEKLAEAEILGRHMARAYMDELGTKVASEDDYDVLLFNLDELSRADIEAFEEEGVVFDKEASAMPLVDTTRGKVVQGIFGYMPKGKSVAGKAIRGIKETFSGARTKRAREALEAAEETAKKKKVGHEGLVKRLKARRETGKGDRDPLTQLMREKATKSGKDVAKAEERIDMARRALRGAQARRAGAIGATGLAAAGAGYGGYRAMKKESSFSSLVEDRAANMAYEWLVENGYNV